MSGAAGDGKNFLLFPCGLSAMARLGFLTAWWPLGHWISAMVAEVSKLRCSRSHGTHGSCSPFYDFTLEITSAGLCGSRHAIGQLTLQGQ